MHELQSPLFSSFGLAATGTVSARRTGALHTRRPVVRTPPPPDATVLPLHQLSVHEPGRVDPAGLVDPAPVRAPVRARVQVRPLGVERRIVQRRRARVGIGRQVGRVVDQPDPERSAHIDRERVCPSSWRRVRTGDSPTDQTGFTQRRDALGTLDPAPLDRFRVRHPPRRLGALLGALQHDLLRSRLRPRRGRQHRRFLSPDLFRKSQNSRQRGSRSRSRLGGIACKGGKPRTVSAFLYARVLVSGTTPRRRHTPHEPFKPLAVCQAAVDDEAPPLFARDGRNDLLQEGRFRVQQRRGGRRVGFQVLGPFRQQARERVRVDPVHDTPFRQVCSGGGDS